MPEFDEEGRVVVPEAEWDEFECWRTFREMYVACEVCGKRVAWNSSWAWVRTFTGDRVRACYECLGKSAVLLSVPAAGERT